MEEVWKDINLAADLRHSPTPAMIFQDFFARDPPPAAPAAVTPPGFSASPPPPPPLQLPTMLTLSSLLLQQQRQQQQPPIPSPERNSGGDRRHKRMIKNRESAARSRARKQAYTNELELEVAHLLEENAKLKKQQQQFVEWRGEGRVRAEVRSDDAHREGVGKVRVHALGGGAEGMEN
ncbi:protein fd [Phtheirospermum japonicum]|uniref:Protein fd n=1 Tax=Phtheirospermum japonicum TaxID=374723 RepID=A0A830C522_9LAMI|nr:protein fd [Phtheirospermum japonicum]